MVHPQVIFLDAVGTLFGIRGSVGAIYSQVAREFGVELSVPELDQAFKASFQDSVPPAFPGVDPSDIPGKEFSWWLAIASQTLKRAGMLHKFPSFPEFFSVLYDHFATEDPWILYPDVYPTLHYWRSQGIELGVISNFDSRLYSVLDALNLSPFFSSVTLSTEVGSAKPDAQIFAIALKKHHCAPESAWHIGDSLNEDYYAAKAANLRSIWLNRPSLKSRL
jgi:putative hydrolase of the HAD superfamily